MGNVQNAPPNQPPPILMDCEHEREWFQMTGIYFPNPPAKDDNLSQLGKLWSGWLYNSLKLLVIFIALEIGVIVGYIAITQQDLFGARSTDMIFLIYLFYALGMIMCRGWYSAQKGILCIDWILFYVVAFFFCATVSVWVSQEIVIFREDFFSYPPFAQAPVLPSYSQSRKFAFYVVFFIETFQLSWCASFVIFYGNAHTWGTPEPEVHAAYRRLFASINPFMIMGLRDFKTKETHQSRLMVTQRNSDTVLINQLYPSVPIPPLKSY